MPDWITLMKPLPPEGENVIKRRQEMRIVRNINFKKFPSPLFIFVASVLASRSPQPSLFKIVPIPAIKLSWVFASTYMARWCTQAARIDRERYIYTYLTSHSSVVACGSGLTVSLLLSLFVTSHLFAPIRTFTFHT